MSLPPIYNTNSRILILGSYPSPKSRAVQFYYGNERNRFWSVLSECLGKSLPCDKEGKTAMLLCSRIALWDTLESCSIIGASDASISNAVPNDIQHILSAAPIKRILCNGATAYRLYQKYNKMHNMQCICLPSTSPANASFSHDRLVSLWLPALSL